MNNIQLTEKQQSCVDFDQKRDLIVQGVAGSGKSLVVVQRAVKFSQFARANGKEVKIAIFTYVKTLVKYTREILALGDKEIVKGIHVNTLDSEILNIYKKLNPRINTKDIYSDKKPKECLDKVLLDLTEPTTPARKAFVSPERRSWLYDEMCWMLQHMLTNEDQYLNCKRKGRGRIQVRREDRAFIFDIYRKYYKMLEKARVKTIDLICADLYKNREKITEDMKYDMVLIDEAQDLPFNKLIIAQQLSRSSVTIAADFAQKIYKTGFTWKEIGLDIKGKGSQKLHGTHRNTRQIALLALGLSQHNTDEHDEDDITTMDLPTREGPLPKLIYCSSHDQQAKDVVTLISRIIKESPKATIGILARNAKCTRAYEHWLTKALIPYEKIENKSEGKAVTPGVKIVTYHSAKGLEFDQVILPLLEDGYFPYTDFDPDRTEEGLEDMMNHARNLLYVGMTRARQMLYMFATDGLGGTPSPLLKELDSDKMEVHP